MSRCQSYTKYEFVFTEAGAEVLGGTEGQIATPYVKGTFLAVPEGEALVVPKPDTFEDIYGCAEADADPEDIQEFADRVSNKETPVAMHLGEAGGQLIYLGFRSGYGGDAMVQKLATHLIRDRLRRPAREF